jgi:hypothetical protein
MYLVHDRHSTPPGPDAPASPVPAAVPYLALAAVALAAGWAAGLSWPNRLVLPIALVLAGAFRSTQRWNEGRRRRAVADAWFERGGQAAQFEWRAEELTSAHERRLLAHSLRGVVKEIRAPGPTSTVPLDRKAIHPHLEELTTIAVRLEDLELPVTPTAILAIDRLLTSPGSPLYMHSNADDLPERLSSITRLLEAR